MGYIRRPAYFKDFHCISSRCTDSCCWHWEIDIDEDTLHYYQQVPGEFGKRLREHIMPPNLDTDEPAHFLSDKRERCPFLNGDNLCDIFIRLGEEHLSYICTHHPRFYDWLLDGQEAGLGLCCEEAARLILQETGYPDFEVIPCPDPADSDPLPDGDLQLEQAFERRLIAMREELFAIIKPESRPVGESVGAAGSPDESSVMASAGPDPLASPSAVLDAKLDRLYDAAFPLQAECDAWFFPDELPEDSCDAVPAELSEGSCDTVPAASSGTGSWTGLFWQADFLEQLIGCFLKLEINDPSWWKQLRRVRDRLPLLLERREAFLSFYQDHLYEYEQLLIYFLYRHFLKAREDLMLTEKITFALISVSMIQLLDLEHWLTAGSLSLKEQIDICKLYSKEIEYDEDNTEQVSLFPLSSPTEAL